MNLLNKLSYIKLSFNNYKTSYFKSNNLKLTKNNSSFILSTFITNLNLNLLKNNNLNFYGRELDIKYLLEILGKRKQNNPLIIGHSGIGKTTLIHYLVNNIIKKLTPFYFENKIILLINFLPFQNNSNSLNLFKKKFQQFLTKLTFNSNIILVFDDFHLIYKLNKLNNFSDLINNIKYYLFKTSNQIIAISSFSDYKNILKDNYFKQLFQLLYISELNSINTLKILYNLQLTIETFYNIKIKKNTLLTLVNLSKKHIKNLYFPSKAITILDKLASQLNSNELSSTSMFILLLNSILNKIKTLRLNAFFDKNNINQHILNDIEKFYSIFSYLLINKSNFIINNFNKNIYISSFLFNKFNLLFFNYFSNLLFPNTKLLINSLNISILLNFEILTKILITLYNFKLPILTNYRSSLILFYSWKKNKFIIFKKFIKLLNIYIFKLHLFKLSNLKYLAKNYLIEMQSIFFNILNKSLFLFNSNFKLKISDILINFNYVDYYLNYSIKSLPFNFILTPILTKQHVINFISFKSGLSLGILTKTEKNKLLNLELTLHKRLIGQTEAVTAITSAIRRSKLGIHNPTRPIASFLFCGPTGVGKTEITKILADILFGSEKNLIRFDMSEFMEKFTVSRLIGSPPGYVGYETGGQLSNEVKKKPYSVILFDEIEKAHVEILNILLQILDDGRLTDNKKQLIYFNNTVIILTSNIGALTILNMFKNKNLSYNTLKHFYSPIKKSSINILLNNNVSKMFLNNLQVKIKHQLNIKLKELYYTSSTTNKKQYLTKFSKNLKLLIYNDLQRYFLPEFLNRIDDIIIFEPLTLNNLRKVCDLMILDISLRLKKQNIFISITNNVRNKLTIDSFNPKFGARPLRRMITKVIENIISENLLKYPHNKLIPRKLNITLNSSNNIISNIINNN